MFNRDTLNQIKREMIQKLSSYEVPYCLYNITVPNSEGSILIVSTGSSNRGKISELQEVFEDIYPQAPKRKINNNSFSLNVSSLHFEKESQKVTTEEIVETFPRKKRSSPLIVFSGPITEASEKSDAIRNIEFTIHGEKLLRLFCEGKSRNEIQQEFGPFFSNKKYDTERNILLYQFKVSNTVDLVKSAIKNGFYSI
jgi:hypothetical protein